MERYILWFAGLGGFYRIVLTLALLVGIASVAASAASDSGLLLVVGLMWLVGGSAFVYLADRRERD
ncbi:MAG: hypothetical protein BRD23_06690 [Halobacteriales archaeon SW_9_67_25]|jgi:hypothetical protein|nr:MAG: hypothetical protein BRD23_06690 [Halobacteriales archaeon SW_9_67_25]